MLIANTFHPHWRRGDGDYSEGKKITWRDGLARSFKSSGIACSIKALTHHVAPDS